MLPDTAVIERERLVHDESRDLIGHAEQVRNVADTHRYLLVRRWLPGGPTAVFVMLNPSTADEKSDDPTIGRCIDFARREGCNALTVVNLFGLRATNPRDLRYAPDPVGQHNDEFIEHLCQPGWLVIAAWGVHGTLNGRARAVTKSLTARGVNLRCFGTTKAGHPCHPLYLPATTPLIPYHAEAHAA